MKLLNSLITQSIGFLLIAVSTSTMAVDFATSRTSANTYSDGVSRFLPLDNAGNTIRWVYLNNTALRAVFYNAECAVRAADNFTWYNINIEMISPAGAVTTISPTNSDNALCTSKGNNTLGNYASNESNGSYSPTQAGWHRIRVRGQLIGFAAGESVRIDDVSLIVTD